MSYPLLLLLATAILPGLAMGASPQASNPHPIGEYSGKYKPTANRWVALNKNMTFSNLSWGPKNYKFDDDRWGHKVVFIDPYNEYEQDSYARFKEMAKDKYILMCYFSAGTFEDYREVTKKWFQEDATRKELFLNNMGDWPDETWLDISKESLMKQYIRFQIDLLADFGCHGVEPDNIDCWANEDCVGSSAGSTTAYNKQLKLVKYMAEYAHSKGLAIAHKNNTSMIKDILDLYDCAIAESAHRYDEASEYKPFLDAGKPVYLNEYTYSGSGSLDKFCDASAEMGMHLKFQDGSGWANCFSDGEHGDGYQFIGPGSGGDDGGNDGADDGAGDGADDGAGDGAGDGADCSKCVCSCVPKPASSNNGTSEGTLRSIDLTASSASSAPVSPPASSSSHKELQMGILKNFLVGAPGGGTSSKNNDLMIGTAAGATGAFVLSAVGILSYNAINRRKENASAQEFEMHDRSHTSSYDFD